jgi:hypothetical protein
MKDAIDMDDDLGCARGIKNAILIQAVIALTALAIWWFL